MNKLVIPILLLLSIGIKAYAQPKIDSITILTGGEWPFPVSNSIPYARGVDTSSILNEHLLIDNNRTLTFNRRNSKLYSSLTTIFTKIIDGKFSRIGTYKDYYFTAGNSLSSTSETFELFSDSLLTNIIDTSKNFIKYYTTRIVIHRVNNSLNDTLLYSIDLSLRYKNKVYLNKEIIMFYLELRKEMVEQCVKEQHKLDDALYRKLKAWADKGEYPEITRRQFNYMRKYNLLLHYEPSVCKCWTSGYLESELAVAYSWCPMYKTLNRVFGYKGLKVIFKKYLDMRILSDIGL